MPAHDAQNGKVDVEILRSREYNCGCDSSSGGHGEGTIELTRLGCRLLFIMFTQTKHFPAPEPTHGFSTHITHMRTQCILTIAFVALVFFIYHYYAGLQATMACRHCDHNLSRYATSIFLPYTEEFSTKKVPEVKATVNGRTFGMPVDTGSTGILIGAPLLPDVDSSEGTPAHHFFSSSNIFYKGRLVDLSITFHGVGTSYAVARVPVFVVDKSFVCPWYDSTRDAFDCPLGPDGEEPIPRNISRITYMGVGFGRNTPESGQPGAVPSKNPFLNVLSINGKSVVPGSLRMGYTMSTRGVHVGLTENNTRGYRFVKLKQGLTYDKDRRDWAMAGMCFSIEGKGANCGYGLVDSGVSQMYIRAETGVSIPTVKIPNPNPNGRAREVERVRPKTNITIGFPTLDGDRAAGYSFVVGEGWRMEPSWVVPAKHTQTTYVNTGRNFLFGYSIAFDAVGGRFGFRPIRPSGPRPCLGDHAD